ncbi:glycine--tRNA ligase subunit beta [Pelagibius litoralis]|uniref:Glycine--tRNA ligase beta subunit n=1 Tax=Pelagibius litoralis TaxID=374515 RepID=A0A967EZE1_9PROT|nr:glycine--tRNA ligase subunit beta [Pelagibius litoralis]NIA70221.1 glycine--tRNA ligase subunit beta [Pelagibius litoralis]
MAELLVELFSEEIPARMQARAAGDLKRLVSEGLKAANLTFDTAAAYATPRRLTLVVDGLPLQQPDLSEEKKGPKVGAPEQAVQGFMKANGLTSLDDAEVRETPKGDFYFAVRHIAGRATVAVLPKLLAKAFGDLPWPKSMRWADDSRRWVRPLHSILALFDGKALDGSFEMAEGRLVAFGDSTEGHRFLAPQRFAVSDFADYRDKLRSAKVVLDADERRSLIAEQATALAAAEGVTLKGDPGLLDEVAGLVEWPQVLMGRIDEAFMTLPGEVLSTSMRSHQKYFSTETADGNLADRFVFVANMEAEPGSDRAETIVSGNERVLKPRLADARFFYDQDRQQPLSARVPTLKDIVFHAKLGTVADKVSRLQSLAVAISEFVPGAERDEARSAARLCKADLVTGMVGEFPELQGIMGRYYALNDGETPAAAEAVAEHYQPLGPNDACPSAPVSICVALADKIDTLVGFWMIDEKPTGSKDPYALRRAALGIIRLVVENKLRLNLTQIFAVAQTEYSSLSAAPVADDLLTFLADRLKVVLRDQGVRHDLITAVLARGGEDDLVRLLARVEALKSFLDSDDGANLLVAYRRAANIVRIEEKKDKRRYDGQVKAEIADQPEEGQLAKLLTEAAGGAKDALGGEDFTTAMQTMAQLRQPVDAFFDKVTVNAEDAALRENRLNLLSAIGATLSEVADFSKIES